MDPNQQKQQNPNRLQLNFAYAGQGGNYSAEQGRAYPTTPSTFPQPLSSASGQQQEVWGTNAQPSSGFTQSGYFMNNPYTAQMQQQASNLQAPTPSYRSPTVPQSNYSDAANGLAQQFAHQNLGTQPRAPSPYGRQPSPAQQQQQQPPSRPRTAGQGSSPQPQYGQFLGSGPPRTDSNTVEEDPPMRNPQKFSSTINNRAKLQSELVATFFKDSVERARDRNARYQYTMRDPHMIMLTES